MMNEESSSADSSASMDDKKKKRSVRVAIIGGGAAGLSALREIVHAQAAASECDDDDVSLEPTLFEERDAVGGVYTRTYEGAMLTTSDHVTSFGAMPSTTERARFLTADEYAEYLHTYAVQNNITPYIHLGTRVVRIQAILDDNAVSSEVPKACISEAREQMDAMCARARYAVTTMLASTTTLTTQIFDHVVICTGTNQIPKPIPSWPGVHDFSGTVMHSSELFNLSFERAFANKRVLLVGLGETASDVSLAVAKVAAATAISSRAGPGVVVPRYFEDTPGDSMMCRAFYALPEPAASNFWAYAFASGARFVGTFYRSRSEANGADETEILRTAARLNVARGAVPNRDFGTKNTSFLEACVRHNTALYPDIARFTSTSVTFVDGSTFECDVVLVNNGYTGRNFAVFDGDDDSESRQTDVAAGTRAFWEDQIQQQLRHELSDVRKMHLNMYPPSFGGGISVHGFARAAFGAVPPIAEMQARLHAAFLVGKVCIPCATSMRASAKRSSAAHARRFGLTGLRIRALVDYLSTMEALAEPLGVSPQPLLWSPTFFLKHHRVWRALLFGPINGWQYYLRGTTETEREAAIEAFERASLSPYLQGHMGRGFTSFFFGSLAARKSMGQRLVGV